MDELPGIIPYFDVLVEHDPAGQRILGDHRASFLQRIFADLLRIIEFTALGVDDDFVPVAQVEKIAGHRPSPGTRAAFLPPRGRYATAFFLNLCLV